MSVTTKSGDKGTTGLYTGERVDKDDPRIETVGTGDELISHLGEVRHLIPSFACDILQIQKNLFTSNSHVASPSMREKFVLADEEILFLEERIKEFEEEYGPLKGFIIPSESLTCARIDIARTVCRRYERRLISLSKHDSIASANMKYVNRLSDYLFMLARIIGKRGE